jgi:hypothetical protein
MLEFSGIVLFACLLKIHPFELLEVPETGRMTVLFKKSLCERIVFSKKYAILFAEKGEQTSGFAGHDVLPGTETAEKQRLREKGSTGGRPANVFSPQLQP